MTVLLSEIQLNTVNPRRITDSKMEQLVVSLLTFPKMLEIRPIVLDVHNVAMGGNMRTKALQAISELTIDQVESKLRQQRKYIALTLPEQQALVEYWDNFLTHRRVPVIYADSMSDSELKEFVIKDNMPYGEWDMDILQEAWDHEDLNEWLDVSFDQEDTDSASEDESETATTNTLIVECVDLDKLEELHIELKRRGFDAKLK